MATLRLSFVFVDVVLIFSGFEGGKNTLHKTTAANITN